MYTETSSTRSIGRRLLGSSLVDVLVGPHGIDRYVELVRPTATIRELRGEVVRLRRLTPDSITLSLRPNHLWRGHRAGQYVRVGVEIDGVRRTRCYSPANAAGSDLLELTIKTHDEGEVSRHLAAHARVGDVLILDAPEGDFHLPENRPEHTLLVSGGSGITPVLSMLRTLCDEGHRDPVTFLYYAPSRRECLYADELDAIAARHSNVRVLRSYTRSDDGDLRGHFGREHLDVAVPGHEAATAFVCGPPGLMDATRETFEDERLHMESFLPPVYAVPADGEVEGTVNFSGSNAAAANDGRPLLDQAEALGLSPESGCRMGICHSCTCRKVSGAVRNVNTGEVSGAPDEDIQICIHVPVGDVELAI